MLDLQDNQFNKRQGRHQAKLKRWRYAGLMLTYRCNAACRFCYYYCEPKEGGLMPTDNAIESWQGLVRIAGPAAKVHITGGEPFLYFDRLAQICQQAARLGLGPVDSIETNAGVFENASSLRDQLRFLDDCGLTRLKISWDTFHEEFVDLAKVKQFIEVARSVLGPPRVLVRWEKHLNNPSGIKNLSETKKTTALKDALAADVCRFTGRAAAELAPLVASHEAVAFQSEHCKNALLGSKGVHIDPFGNVFNGQCSGMILGNVTHKPLDVIWTEFEPDQHKFWSTLYESGPYGWLESAIRKGFLKQDLYAGKCHLCTDIRCFFFDNQVLSPIIGPDECYGR